MANKVKNLKHLKKEVLQLDEEVLHAIEGNYETKYLYRRGVFAATNKRLIFFGKKATGYDSEVFNYNNISTFETGKKIMGHYITFYSSGNDVYLKWIQDNEFNDFVNYVNNRIEKNTMEDKKVSAKGNNNLEQIKQLKELLDMSAITEEEYNKKKDILLNL